MIDTKTENLLPYTPAKLPSPLPWVKIAGAVVVLGIIAFLVTNKGLFVAAVVDGQPIFRWDLNSTLMSRYGSQTLDAMISQRLIDEQAAKEGVSVSQAEMDGRIQSLVANMGGGMTIDQLLQYQGMTRADFDSQLKLQLTVEKLLGKGVTVSDPEIADYIATNSANMTATTDTGMKTEAKDAIMQQKISSQLPTWFAGIKAKASILRFIQ